jgi:hypothetical protein
MFKNLAHILLSNYVQQYQPPLYFINNKTQKRSFVFCAASYCADIVKLRQKLFFHTKIVNTERIILISGFKQG